MTTVVGVGLIACIRFPRRGAALPCRSWATPGAGGWP